MVFYLRGAEQRRCNRRVAVSQTLLFVAILFPRDLIEAVVKIIGYIGTCKVELHVRKSDA